MKVRINVNERYPDFTVTGERTARDYGYKEDDLVEIPDELYEKAVRVEEEYNELQEELKKYV